MSDEAEKSTSIVGKIVKVVVIIALLGVIYYFGKKAFSGNLSYSNVKKAQKLMDEKKYDDAIKLLDRVKDMESPYKKNANFELGKCWMHKGMEAADKKDYKGATECFQKSIEAYGKADEKQEQIQILRNLVDVQLTANDYSGMVKSCEQWLKLDPESADAKRFHKMAYQASEIDQKRAKNAQKK